ncbi:MAG: ROK family protein [Prevotellaceae bacterium]|jgi:glucokinase|nr:ROK family protein [Prevotellaceae bacterium]
MPVIALDIGGTKISGAYFQADGTPLHHAKRLLEQRTGEEVGDLAIEVIRDVLSASPSPSKIDGIGICIPGIVYSKTERVWAPNIRGWDNFPLAAHIRAGLPELPVPIFIESDRSCHILGEVWKGAARGCDNAVFIAVGTGIGVGIIIDGKLLHGESDIIGAAGWMALQPPYTQEYDACGCFESYASGFGLGMQARKMLREDKAYNGPMREKPVEEVSAYDVFAHYPEGDAIAVAVLRKAVELWGMASANLVSLLNPQKVIWGGGIFGPACFLIDDIYRQALQWAQPISIRQAQFVASQVEDAGLLGAAYLVIRDTNK